MAPSRAFLPFRSICTTCSRHRMIRRKYSITPILRYADESHLPRIVTPSFWTSLIPKPFRRSTGPLKDGEGVKIKTPRSKEWNPATIFIILGILVGSNAIQILSLRREMLNFSRKTDAKLSLLREVVQRVKNGEDFDVKKALGTGDPQQEAEWEEVIKELEETDMLAEGRRKREMKKAEKAEKRRLEEEAGQLEASPKAQESDGKQDQAGGRPKFMM